MTPGPDAQQARENDQRRWRQMPRHRSCHLPQRIGENIRQHQVERPAARIAAPKNRWRGSSPRDCPAPLSRAFSRATRTEGGSMSLASTRSCSALAAAMASTPVPVPRSSTRRGRQRLQHMIEQQQAAARGAVMAGAERQRRLDLDAELVGRHPLAVMLAMHDKAAGGDRDQIFEAGLDPVLGLDGVEGDVLCDVSPAARPPIRGSGLIGRIGKMHGDVPAPVRPLERGDRGLAFEENFGQESTTRLAARSSPMAKLARWRRGDGGHWRTWRKREKAGVGEVHFIQI